MPFAPKRACANASLQQSLEMSLREHLLAAGAGQPQPPPQPVAPGPQAHAPDVHGHHHIDPAIAGSGYPMSAGEAGDGHLSEGGRKGRRELSTSKRAAQNRAAQRAFRQRKEEYIKSLKDQVKDYEQMATSYKAIQAENYALRDYIINLQSRLVEAQGTFPDPPADINLSREEGADHHHHQPQNNQAHQAQNHLGQSQHDSMSAPTAPMTSSAAAQLQAAASQAAAAQAAAAHASTELNNGQKHGHQHEDPQYMTGGEYPPAKRPRSEENGGGGAGMTSVNAGGNAELHSPYSAPHHPTSAHQHPHHPHPHHQHQHSFSGAGTAHTPSPSAHSAPSTLHHSPASSSALPPRADSSSSAGFPAYAPVSYNHLVQHPHQQQPSNSSTPQPAPGQAPHQQGPHPQHQQPQPQPQASSDGMKVEGDEAMAAVLRAESARQEALQQREREQQQQQQQHEGASQEKA
ncbi:uncharacterized protein K452DRAFT_303192 [Aplosporella prunicola CBS 121167]|uniref:Putative transcription factor kapC n=1 Tax=Aplosporella prunicola CBS 121167 TaxID=1176127 RepID=A0A6A6AY60_9PEZI|nr:uncharacterized protein K452DRAFT_303192 [Aplosporella prunicola CBS 121167]KAF2135915.1 hypothetical protein K452DRAFT_303192 [Aplosporella prunicola CBS 121167]